MNPQIYNLRHLNELIVPHPRVDTIKINFPYQFTLNCNNLNENIKNSENQKIFKKVYKRFLLEG